MDKIERGKRAKIGIYDDHWLCVDDAVEMVVPSFRLLHEERYEKIIDELNLLGCTSFTLTSEQIKSLLNKKDGD